jgi:hypothetical protein
MGNIIIWPTHVSTFIYNTLQVKYIADIVVIKVHKQDLIYRLQKDQQILKEVVDVLLIPSKFSTPTFFT